MALAIIAGPFPLCAQPGYVLRPAERKPSIIFILADDLGYGDLGCYGQTKIKTPNLDKLAAEGMRFTSFYAGSTVCAPSRCALMTGLHTGHALIRGNATVPLRPQDLTVAEVLKQAGYHTALIGKWGLGNPNTTGVPQKKGFDEFLGYLDQVHAHDYYTDYLWRYDPPTDAKPGYDGRVEFPENRDGKKGKYMDDLVHAAALKFRAHQQAGLRSITIGRSSFTSPTPFRTRTTRKASAPATAWKCPATRLIPMSRGRRRKRTRRR